MVSDAREAAGRLPKTRTALSCRAGGGGTSQAAALGESGDEL